MGILAWGSDGRTWADNPGQDGVEWGADDGTIYYRTEDEAKRPYKVPRPRAPTPVPGAGQTRVGPAARSKLQTMLVARQPPPLHRRRPDVERLRVAAPARAPI